MSDSREPPAQAGTSTGCLSLLLLGLGAILLFPGVCAALFMVGAAFSRDQYFRLNDPALITLWLACFAVSLAGAALIWRVGRRRSR
jgi:hypothetical protein